MGIFSQADVAGTCIHGNTWGNRLARISLALMLAVMMLGTMAGLSSEKAVAGQVATINTDGAGLMASFENQSIVEWMYAGDLVDVLWGPENGKYEVRYYGVDGWVWAEYLNLGGQGGGGSASSAAVVQEHWIDVDRSQGSVTLFVGNQAQATFWGSMGWEDTSYGYYATAVGTYYVTWMNPDLQYTPFAENYITHWVGFDGERANGFHSYTKDENGSITPNGAGKTAGCVALAPGDINALYEFAYPGMRVEVHW